MVRRRSFGNLICRRFLPAIAIACLIGASYLIGWISDPKHIIAGFFGGVFAALVRFFREDGSQPRGLKIHLGGKLDIEDASGQITEGIEFGVERWLWFTKIVYCRYGKVIRIPLDMFQMSRRELLKAIGI